MTRPVDVARLLTDNGLTLRKAHDAVNRLTKVEIVPVELPAVSDLAGLLASLESMGVHGSRRSEPPPVDIPALRERMGLTQREFATRFGFELGNLRNWEQERSPQDTATRLFLHVIARHPEVVDEVVDKVATAAE
ncbi:helix-turn-helix domain-containing protein [Azospirillum griseum]|uniref:helix-turn-helix domain-containing protein n=1 Tax=Azospirillum griseum TaxID=2496639 RepID=UPI00363513E4